MLFEFPLSTIVLGQSINFAEALTFSASKSADILYLLLTSILIRFLLEISGQRWIKTFSQTATLIILPIVTYIITSVIAGNIALSLGMVGALSIVRFRNPVRSPFELSVLNKKLVLFIIAYWSFCSYSNIASVKFVNGNFFSDTNEAEFSEIFIYQLIYKKPN